MDIIKVNNFPRNVIAGLATGYSETYNKMSFYKTENYSLQNVISSRKQYERHIYSEQSCDFKFIYQNQNHTDKILILNKDSKYDSKISDALITDSTNVILNISVADCAAVLVYDKNKNIVAAVHSGWRGTKLNIIGKTIDKMSKVYNSKPNDLITELLPSALVNCYEVGEEFLEYFPNSTVKSNGKIYFDNKKEIVNQLLDCSVLKSNITISNECTIKNNRFHSFRRDRSKAGRMNAFIGIID